MNALKNKSQFVICGTDTDIGKTLTVFTNLPIIAEFPYIQKIDSNHLDILWEELNIKLSLIHI